MEIRYITIIRDKPYSWFSAKEYNITENIQPIIEELERKEGIHKLDIMGKFYCYGYNDDNKISVVVFDTEPKPSAIWAILAKIHQAKNAHDLTLIGQHPEKYMQTNIDITRDEIEKVKAIMLENIDKVMARSQRIEELLAKTEELLPITQQFRLKARDLKDSQRCPGFLSIFKPISNLIWGATNYVYEYFPKPGKRLELK